jgi:hypothetical protein
MVQNILGNGIDIPLLGLREASKEVEGEYHELFTDESFKISQCFLLSTSQVIKLIKVKLLNAQLIFNAQFCTIRQLHNKTLFLHNKNVCNFFNSTNSKFFYL